MKKFLFIISKSAGGVPDQEALDQIMSAADYDQAVSLQFIDDGVFQIKKNQRPDELELKATAAIFEALEIYDVNAFYAETESLEQRGLSTQDLCLPVKLLARSQIAAFIKQHERILPG
ncbi:MAG: sulfurtransferase complex subunit TusC [Methylicorpusculum sp.]|nr:sulfurtransferase complex subunit TusC [Methylicorpusculum sp.]